MPRPVVFASMAGIALAGMAFLAVHPAPTGASAALMREREALFHVMMTELQPDQMAKVVAIFQRSLVLGQGNPDITVHPMTLAECRAIRDASASEIVPGDAACGAPNMVAVYDPTAGETARDARVCIDQYEFPDIPCVYPVVHVTAREAVELCEAVGKRICDAHEWEGACAGALREPAQEYAWGHSRTEMMQRHNASRERVWAYGPEKDHSRCATNSEKTPGCPGGGWTQCGSNTYPAGAFLKCASRFGVYDQHGNVAEHMNLPLEPDELSSAGNGKYGWTEMKGSWFIFARDEAHEDDCRWRAPDWHGSRITSPASHSNYHLGFRCCKSLRP